ncbi:MAG: DUF1127 domain-containing protein [Bacteroidota bacterium]
MISIFMGSRCRHCEVMSICSQPSPLRLRRTAARNCLAIAALWLRRWRTRKELAEIDDHLLKDVGLSERERAAECRKPFWR